LKIKRIRNEVEILVNKGVTLKFCILMWILSKREGKERKQKERKHHWHRIVTPTPTHDALTRKEWSRASNDMVKIVVWLLGGAAHVA
jgi:hypothetical protein